MSSKLRSRERKAAKKPIRVRARQETDKKALQEKILTAARKEFGNGSVEDVSIQRIANSLGYSKSTILKYFPTKIALLISVKEKNLREIVDHLEVIAASERDSRERLRAIAIAYIDYWVANPDHFKSLFSMAGTMEDRRLPDGTYFGQTPIAKRAYGIFVESIDRFISSTGTLPSTEVSQALSTVLVAALHGVISLPLSTPSMHWPDISGKGQLIVETLLHSWGVKLDLLKRTKRWPAISLQDFLANPTLQ